MIYLLNNSRYFDFVIKGLDECFNQLKIDYKLVNEYIEDSANIYILCTTHEQRPLPKKYISYNFEQLTTDKIWDEQFFIKLKNAVEVWDYSLENIKILNAKGINAKFVPLGITNTIDYNIVRSEPRILDFMFYGCLNDNRLNKLNNLLQIYYKSREKYYISNNCWGNNQINVIKACKIGINLHFYTGKTILEIHRLYPLIINKVWVVTEYSDDKWYDEKLKEYVTFCNSNDLVKTIVNIIKLPNDEFEQILEDRKQKIIKEMNYTDIIKDYLKDSLIFTSV